MNAEGRGKCWAARDLYLGCLEQLCQTAIHYKEGTAYFKCPSGCEQKREAASQVCPPLWLLHFEHKWATDQLRINPNLQLRNN